METGTFVVGAGSLNILHVPVSIREYLAAATGSRIVAQPEVIGARWGSPSSAHDPELPVQEIIVYELATFRSCGLLPDFRNPTAVSDREQSFGTIRAPRVGLESTPGPSVMSSLLVSIRKSEEHQFGKRPGHMNSIPPGSRDAPGVHWRSDGIEGMKLGEAVALSILRDVATLYHEEFPGFNLTLFDGRTVTICPEC